MAVVLYDGYKFHKDKYGYYVSPRCLGRVKLHRYIWEKENGRIPEGYVIHHIDKDKENNSLDNLMCLTNSQHAKIHSKDYTEDGLRRLSAASSGINNYWYGKNRSGKNNPRYGVKLSEDLKYKMGNNKRKTVICLETGVIYGSIKEAFEETKIHNISAVCRGVKEKAGGLHWSYYEGGTPSP